MKVKQRALTLGSAIALLVLPNHILAQSGFSFSGGLDAFSVWSADNQYTNLFGGALRWGNSDDDGGAWEIAVQDAAGTVLKKAQYEWDDTDYWGFYYNPNYSSGTAALGATEDDDLDDVRYAKSDVGSHSVNTLLLEGLASGSSSARARFRIYSLGKEMLFESSLQGDSPSNWVGLTDSRLEDGFFIVGSVSLDGGSYSDPRIQIRAGSSLGASSTVTPEPVSVALLGTGLVGLGAVRRRRRKETEVA